MNMKELLKRKIMLVDPIVLESVSKYKLDVYEFLLLLYFINNDSCIFDLKNISSYLTIDEKTLLVSFNSLVKKKIISVATKKNENGKMSEYINADNFYDEIVLDINNNNDDHNDIFALFEKEFCRTLSSMEYEIINNWIEEKKYPQELIVSALKEAVFSGANNLRYIDKILFEWNKKGFKNLKDVDNHLAKKNKSEKPQELYDYDWLSDENN